MQDDDPNHVQFRPVRDFSWIQTLLVKNYKKYIFFRFRRYHQSPHQKGPENGKIRSRDPRIFENFQS